MRIFCLWVRYAFYFGSKLAKVEFNSRMSSVGLRTGDVVREVFLAHR